MNDVSTIVNARVDAQKKNRFIEDDERCPRINMSHVAELRPREVASRGRVSGKDLPSAAAYDAYAADGRLMGTVDAWELDHRKPSGVTPNNSGAVMVRIELDDKQPGGVCVTREPILAWSVEDGCAEAVLIDDVPGGWTCIELPAPGAGTTWRVPFGSTYGSFEDVLAAAVARLREEKALEE